MLIVAMGPGRRAVPGAAHQPNESVLIDEHLIPFVKVLALLIVEWCGVVEAPTSHDPTVASGTVSVENENGV